MIFCPEGQINNELTPNREKIDLIRRMLFVVWTLQIVIASGMLVVSFWMCLLSLFAAFVLFLSITQLNSCNCVVFIVLSILKIFSIIAFIGERLQRHEDLFKTMPFKTSLCYFDLGFNSFAIPIVFSAYRHFKEMVLDMLLSQTNCEQESLITCESTISINGFQQPLRIIDLEQPINQPFQSIHRTSLFNMPNNHPLAASATASEIAISFSDSLTEHQVESSDSPTNSKPFHFNGGQRNNNQSHPRHHRQILIEMAQSTADSYSDSFQFQPQYSFQAQTALDP